MISNCGFPDRSQFQVISLWINRVAAMMQTDLTGEIYAPQGRFLTAAPDELRLALTDYLTLLENAGKEISAGLRLSERTAQLLKQSPCWELVPARRQGQVDGAVARWRPVQCRSARQDQKRHTADSLRLTAKQNDER